MGKGKLCVISTPIGNLKDITLRAIEELKNSDMVLAEDTRITRKLFNHYNINSKLVSYHKFNEKKQTGDIIFRIKNGQIISLVSDAGTPLFSDPGYILVKRCIEEGIKIDVVPGPSSILSALIISGFNPEKFYFAGFLPKKPNEKLKEIMNLKKINCPVVLFESPLRIKETLKLILENLGNFQAAVVKEMTKIYEEVFYGKISNLINEIPDEKLKGEFVVIILPSEMENKISDSVINKKIAELSEQKIAAKDIAKKISQETGIKKNEIYKKILQIKNGG